MNLTSQSNGVSARRKSILLDIKPFFKIVCFLAMFAGLSFAFTACDSSAQESAAKRSKEQNVASVDSLDKPKVNIKVNRHYDAKGNVIRFDSTYSSFYSNVDGDTLKMDSLMNNFNRFFNRSHSSLFDRRFNTLFFRDSARSQDFFNTDFFMKRYELNDDYLRDMMREMDSIKNDFFIDQGKQTDQTKVDI
jgi:hypothetical protein